MKMQASYVIAHEGASFGVITGLGGARKYWAAKRIRELANKINSEKPPVFHNHCRNPAITRVPIGYITRCITCRTEGRLEALVFVCFNLVEEEKEKIKRLNIASIEADITARETRNGWKVLKVNKVIGVALSEKNKYDPGFPYARLVTLVT